MRPIKLVMSAFGSYAEKAAIDFSKYDKNEVFLITGETGAGKTTIFDAICFALFSEASCVQASDSQSKKRKSEPGIKRSNDRDRKNLLTDYPVEKLTASFVELTFSHNGKEYVVKRMVYYQNKDSVRCTAEDWTVEGQTEVNKKISEILNINVFQFKQIAMIAQGEFKKLITAATGDRAAILRMLFGTDGYAKMADKLDKKTNYLKTKYEEYEKEANRYYNDAKCDMENLSLEQKAETLDRFIGEKTKELEKEKEKLDNQGKIRDKNKSIYDEIQAVNKLFDDLETAENEKKRLEAKKTKIAALEDKLSKYDKAVAKINVVYNNIKTQKDKFSDLEKSIQNLLKEKETNEKELDKIKQDIDKIPDMEKGEKKKRKDAGIIENDLQKYKDREKLAGDIKAARQAAEKAKKTADELEKEKKKLQDDINKKNETIKELEKIPAILNEKGQKLQKAETDKKNAETLFKDAGAYKSLFDEIEVLRAAAADKLKTYNDAKTAYDTYERRFDAARLGILAEKLRDGEPCPLCGAEHHPRPAVKSKQDEDLNEVELKRLKKAMQDAEKDKNDAVETLKGEEGGLKNKKQALEETFISFDLTFDEHYLENAKKNERLSAEAYKIVSDEYGELKKKNSELEEARNELDKLMEKLKPLDGEITEANNKKAEKTSELAALEGKAEAFKDLKFDSYTTAETEMNSLLKKAQEISDSIQGIRDRERKISDVATSLETSLKEKNKDKNQASENIGKYSAQFQSKLEECGLADEKEYLDIIGIDKEAVNTECKAYKTAVDTNKGQIGTLTKQINGRKRGDESKAKDDWERANKLYADSDENVKALERLVENHKEYRKKALEQKAEYDKCYPQYLVYAKLNDVISAETTGKNKITFENYMQRAIFERVLTASNERLGSMSDKRLELKLHDLDIEKEKTATSLDLDVKDNYTGKIRPASTLSGGESFITSLALALGLSDTVTGENGGVNIDALFIDEGFGNLDASTIQKAIEAVFSLQKEDKLVGVISHREELITAVETQIEVWKDANGSHLRQLV